MKRLVDSRHEDGASATVVALLFAFVLFGLAALVVDVGSMYTTKRDAQNMADAAALAGVRDLPSAPTDAKAAATYYLNANKNHDYGTSPEIDVYATNAANDTITVKVYPNAPTFFARTWGIVAEQVNAKATAMVASPSGYRGCMPFGVMSKDGVNGPFGYTFNEFVTLKRGAGSGAQGNYGFVALTNPPGGSGGGMSTLRSQIENGGANVPVYLYSDYKTMPGKNGDKVWDSLTTWLNKDGTDLKPASAVYRQNDDGTVDILDYSCHQLIVCPIIRTTTQPPSYSWDDTNGASVKVEVIGFGWFFIESIKSDKTTGKECWITGRFIRPVLNAESHGVTSWGPNDPYGAISFKLVD